ncbi:uncharacterized protein BYT42DRAFT_538182 [Radiomyces spectabilis]|uniref:uncharacterized protein n=1 Tax=Radiomyces spectabilis TaxID=64574 RepID=UPI0022209897|nr:uncharacterized protein BYT42DRAFT_538182 [Radiomyces spectabilis]KAI8370605.1 hypothetical protein BYT42DRAFT_538182 [Radiomyces spectabilis]
MVSETPLQQPPVVTQSVSASASDYSSPMPALDMPRNPNGGSPVTDTVRRLHPIEHSNSRHSSPLRSSPAPVLSTSPAMHELHPSSTHGPPMSDMPSNSLLGSTLPYRSPVTTSIPVRVSPPYERQRDAATQSPQASTVTPSSSGNPSAGGYRPLNVKDALTYLDQVKVKFADQPDVYNRFLDIMKDFKSQAIDTPGVIERVSTLFKGYPALISGFNTFLPPGYRIECSVDAYERDIIKVTTPSGVTSTTHGEPLNLPSDTPMTADAPPPPPPPSHYYPHLSTSIPYHPSSMSYDVTNRGTSRNVDPPPIPAPLLPIYHHHTSSPQAQPSQINGMSETDASSNRRVPVEFNHAINYVNKIKNRFAADPEIYKQFLEILQTYQKEQKPIQEVYAQVQELFNGATDLLTEFKQFLPDTSASQPMAGSVLFGGVSSKDNIGKRKRGGLAATAGSVSKNLKRSKLLHKPDIQLSDVRSDINPDFDFDGPNFAADETEFFDRVKKHINNKSNYLLFLKMLHLFSEQRIDHNELIDRLGNLIGDNKELYDKLKTLVGYDGTDCIIENIPATSVKYDLSRCKINGVSYRRLPREWRNDVCSARDSLCKEVLNDAYVLRPLWSRENARYVTKKRNPYEDAMNRTEEERYDYDLNIESNLSTIALLEPIAKRLSTMTEEEKAELRLPVGLGGPSKTIYQSVIKKIYGKTRAADVIRSLHENPSVAVPIILTRLRQKDDEWRKAQRQWNKVWREIETRNYFRSLDYQGLSFKKMDKKIISTKELIEEIEGSSEMQDLSISASRHGRDRQLLYSFEDRPLFRDVTRLLYSFLERQTLYTVDECELMRSFIEVFIPALFDIPDIQPDMDLSEQESEESRLRQSDDSETEIMSASAQRSSGRGRGFSKRSTTRRKKPLNNRKSRRRRGYTPKEEVQDDSADVPDPSVEEDDAETGIVSKDADNDTVTDTAPSISDYPAAVPVNSVDDELVRDSLFYFFGNDHFYCFLRLYQIIYDRLGKMKALDAEYKSDIEKEKKANKTLMEIGVMNKQYHGIEIDGDRGYYRTMHNIIDRFFEGEVDHQIFEECIRYLYGNQGYFIFPIGKLMVAIMRQMHFIIADKSTQEILDLMKKTNEAERVTSEILKQYQSTVKRMIGDDEKLYKFTFNYQDRILSIQMATSGTAAEKTKEMEDYNAYVSEFFNWAEATPGIQMNELRRPFLARNRTIGSIDEPRRMDRLEYNICPSTYRLFYVNHTEDMLFRKRDTDMTDNEGKPVTFPFHQRNIKILS